MNDERFPPLFFHEFFRRVSHELGYGQSPQKYMEFCSAVAAGLVPLGEEGELLRFMRAFLMQNEQHREAFDGIFKEELAGEKRRMRTAFEKWATPEAGPVDEKPAATPSGAASQPPPPMPAQPPATDAGKKKSKEVADEPEAEETTDMWFMLGHAEPEGGLDGKAGQPAAASFNLSDEYFPLTRRELMKTWQYLRLRQPAGVSDRVDIAATVERVARDGLFTEAVHEKNWATRPEALLILVDRDDAMTPFHELADRITATATDRSAHPRAGVWYFHKYPANWLYQKPTLTEAREVGLALRPCNAQNTLALIVSDGGAARGEAVDSERAMGMANFLAELRKKVAYVAWLNPLPASRWPGTAAETIQTKLQVPMYSALDGFGFPQAVQSLMEQKGY